MLGANASPATWLDSSPVRNIAAQLEGVFIVYPAFISAKGANFGLENETTPLLSYFLSPLTFLHALIYASFSNFKCLKR
jgi:hypothetical protein